MFYMTLKLNSKKCLPCEGGVAPLTPDAIQTYSTEVKDWTVTEDSKKIRREFIFKNFVSALEFVNKVADLAEQENHHPDIHIFYNKVVLELWTHAIGGLSENDFIVAAKIDVQKLETRS
ncbi:4a-hydroxytetrahydrobiopterin dehydratase [Candidatus Azambacteria bacterium]|nr:4a-hydroxytetrahydrobiopterin dehydratase [Candidatus Azambacteria bacterium]